MDKIAVTGPRGRLGSELVRRGCIPVEANVTDFVELNQALLDIKPDVVIHCAAKTDVDMCETAAMEAMKVNAGGTYGLAQVYQGKIVYISTDYIFDGENGPYDEKAKPNPKSIYGWSKLGGEIALQNRGNPNDLIIRTTVLFDRYSKNFVTTVIQTLLRGDTVLAPDNLYGSPTYIPHLGEGILKAIRENRTGILNVAGSRVMSRFHLARMISHFLNKGSVKKLTEWKTRAPRPLRAGLKGSKYGYCGYDPFDGIKEIISALETMEAG